MVFPIFCVLLMRMGLLLKNELSARSQDSEKMS